VAATVQRRYKGSFIRALLDVFPDIGLDQTKFAIVPRKFFFFLFCFSVTFEKERKILRITDHYWQNIDNRRNFFIEVARSKGFDPLVAKSWYSKANRMAMLSERVTYLFKFKLNGQLNFILLLYIFSELRQYWKTMEITLWTRSYTSFRKSE
jgi:hypothetical protein